MTDVGSVQAGTAEAAPGPPRVRVQVVPLRGLPIASYCVVGVMAVIVLGVLEPANIAVLVEMRKQRPDGEVIALLMRRFIYTAGITGLMQVATLIIMTRVATQ